MAPQTYGIRTAIIGAGRIAGAIATPGDTAIISHAHAIAADSRFWLGWVIDTSLDRARSLAQRWGAPAFAADLQILASADRLDVIVVCTPDVLHAVMLETLLCLPAPPRLVVMEKPLCLTSAELKGLVRVTAEHPEVAVVVNHSRRFDARYHSLACFLAENTLGELVGVRWVYYGGWRHNGPHVIDTIRLLLNGSLEVTDAWQGFTDRPGDPCLEARLRCSAHPQARILIESFPEQAFQLFEAEIRLRLGRIRLLDFGAEILVDEVRANAVGERELRITRPFECPPALPAMAGLYDSVAAFLLHGDKTVLHWAGMTCAAETMRTLFAVSKMVASRMPKPHPAQSPEI